MLQGCSNPNPVRGFHAEHLIQELKDQRKVIDVLGNYELIEPSADQIAGVGFNATVRDEIVVRTTSGTRKQIYKVQF